MAKRAPGYENWAEQMKARRHIKGEGTFVGEVTPITLTNGETTEMGTYEVMPPESRMLTISIPIGDANITQVTDRWGNVIQKPEFTEAQWQAIETCALLNIHYQIEHWVSELISPELDFWEPSESEFPNPEEEGISKEEEEARYEAQFDGMGAVCEVLEKITAHFGGGEHESYSG